MFANWPFALTFLKNLYKARVKGETLLDPMAITWHTTNRCNFKCDFCDDGKGNRYPDMKSYTMTTEEVKHVLSLARQKVVVLFITGGEPLMRKDLSEIARWAKEDARFTYIAMVTNGVLLHRQEALLNHVDDLAISLHSLDEDWCDKLLNAGSGQCKAIKEAIKRYGSLSKDYGYRFNVSCVVFPHKIQDARDVMNFCFDNDAPFAVMPQSVTPYPHPDLENNGEYVDFIDDVVAAKRKGLPVWGSYAYFETIRDFKKFKCYPTTVPRIFANGDLVYPCSPLDTVAGNLINSSSFDEVMKQGIEKHGAIPKCDTRCFAQCYVESSHSVEYPAQLVWDNLVLMYKMRGKA